MLTIHIIDMLHVQDNYNFLLRDEDSGLTAVVDPSEANGVLDALAERGWGLDYILNTHHHWDHTNGNKKLKRETGCQVVGYRDDAARIPDIDVLVDEGEPFALGQSEAQILAVPGHVIGHIAYYFAHSQALFCGDALFAMGCGRLFEGTPAQMHHSLQKLAALPDDTRVFCAHEYTIPNGRFARSVEPDNDAINAQIEQARARRRDGQPSIPTLMGEEKATNPFLRTHSASIRTTLQMQDASDEAIFAALRARKDGF